MNETQHDDLADLEAALRSGRAELRRDVLDSLTKRIEQHGRTVPARRLRVGFATVFVSVVVAALAGFGGLGYATTSAKNAATGVTHAVRSVSSATSGRADGAKAKGSSSSKREREGDGDNGNRGDSGSGGDDSNGNSGRDGNGSDNGNGEDEDDRGAEHENGASDHQYSRWVLVCYPFQQRSGGIRWRTVVVPRGKLSQLAPPGVPGRCAKVAP